jgi:hypothetical protein
VTHRHGDAWEVRWDTRSGRPHLIQGVGVPLLPGRGRTASRGPGGRTRALTLDDVERAARAFLGRHPGLLRVDPGALRLDRARSLAIDEGRVWLLELQQVHEGVPVEGAAVFFRINNGNIVQVGADRVADVTAAVEARVAREEAFSALLQRAGAQAAEAVHASDAGSLRFLPVLPEGEEPGRGYAGPAGRGYEHLLVWQFSFRLAGQDTAYVARVDAHTGAVVQVQDLSRDADALVQGGIYPRTNTDAAVWRPFPYLYVENPTRKVTTVSGLYDYTGGAASASLAGRHVTVSDGCGASGRSVFAPGHIDFGSSLGTDCTTPGVGGAGNTHAARNAFYHLTSLNREVAPYLPYNKWLAGAVAAEVNRSGTHCNAFWTGSAVRTFKGGGGCSNGGEIAGLLAHEWSHALDQNAGGTAPDFASGEAAGDTGAMLYTRESCVAPNLQPGVNCFNCVACTGVRDPGDFAAFGGSRPIARPSNIAVTGGIDCDRFACPFTGFEGVMGYQAHCESQIASSANWDLAVLLRWTKGEEQGWAQMERIWYGSLTTGKSAYRLAGGGRCNPAAAVDGCAATNWYTVYLAVDDDNGNLADGTPNLCLIWAAFDAHGIACGPRPPGC